MFFETKHSEVEIDEVGDSASDSEGKMEMTTMKCGLIDGFEGFSVNRGWTEGKVGAFEVQKRVAGVHSIISCMTN